MRPPDERLAHLTPEERRQFQRMRATAQTRGKPVPTVDELLAVWASTCQICDTPMRFAPDFAGRIRGSASLQHWNEEEQRAAGIGPYGLVHHKCNVWHANARASAESRGEVFNLAEEKEMNRQRAAAGWHQLSQPKTPATWARIRWKAKRAAMLLAITQALQRRADEIDAQERAPGGAA